MFFKKVVAKLQFLNTRKRLLDLNRPRLWAAPLSCIGIVSVLLVGTFPAMSQTNQSSTGDCSPIISQVEGDVKLDFNCTSSTVYQYTMVAPQAEFLASYYGVSVDAVDNLFGRLGDEKTPPYLVQDKFEALAREIVSMRDALSAISTRGKSNEIRSRALSAISIGDLELAADLYDELADSIQDDLDGVVEQARGYSQTLVLKGRNELLLYRFSKATVSFQSALDALPGKYSKDRAEILTLLAESLFLSTQTNSNRGLVLQASSLAADEAKEFRASDPALYLKALTGYQRALFIEGDVDSAKSLFNDRILPLLKDKNVKSLPEGLFCFACMGGAFMNSGDTEQAIIVLEAGVEFSKDLIFPDNVALASIYLNLGRSYEEENKAIEALNQSLDLLERRFPERTHPDISNVLSSIASNTEDASIAQELISDALEVIYKTVGSDETFLPMALESGLFFGGSIDFSNNQFSYIRHRRDEIPADLFEATALENIRKYQPADIADTQLAIFWYQLGVLHLSNGFAREATQYYRKSVDLFGNDTESIQYAYGTFILAQLLDIDGFGEPNEAEYYYLKALPAYEAIEGEFAEFTHHVRLATVQFYKVVKQYNKGRDLIQRFELKCREFDDCSVQWQVDELWEMLG